MTHPLHARTLFLDLEVDRGDRIHHVGAVLGDRTFDVRSPRSADWAALDAFARPARLIAGHNILRHDLPLLADASDLDLLRIPAVDTLFLSPLAFPARPYHHLVKGHRLVQEAANDPVADARLARELLDDEAEVLADHPLSPFLRHALDTLAADRPWAGGHRAWLDALGVPALPLDEAVDALVSGILVERTCDAALLELLDELPARDQLPLAYAAAWIGVADTASVLPAWVRHEHPRVPALVRHLRDRPCDSPSCAWCAHIHDPDRLLRRLFGYEAYRPEPATAEGHSAQRAIVSAGLADRSLYAVLPTGGGKTLCYQVPAMARYERRGALTVVISPLQALMKDQVEGFAAKTGSLQAAALYGMLTLPERRQVMRGVSDGFVALLYVSPEQLRNRSVRRVLARREIGCWVFDEAHCLSKWGHDFRTDYLYAPRFIAELADEQGVEPPPVACFTATSQQAVTDEIRALFADRLGHDLELFDRGIERSNLQFDVRAAPSAQKLDTLLELLADHLEPGAHGAAIVFDASRRGTEDLAATLAQRGWSAAAYHAGLEPERRRKIQDRFLAGELQVVCATSAFGMGIDKEDVRLVVHHRIPGSLESYLQQAGRAGRDRQTAHCLLLFDRRDIDKQFQLFARARLTRRDIDAVLRTVRKLRRADAPLEVTTGELARLESTGHRFDPEDHLVDTYLHTAVSWLERAHLLRRDHNVTTVFQGRPRLRTRQAARERIRALGLDDAEAARWELLYRELLDAPPDAGLTADDLADWGREIAGDGESPLGAGRRLVQTLQDMARAGLISEGIRMTARLRYKVKDHSDLRLARSATIEQALLDELREAHPDADQDDEQWERVDLRLLNQHLLDRASGDDDPLHAVRPTTLRALFRALAQDGRGFANRHGSLDLRFGGHHRLHLRLRRTWEAVVRTSRRRRAVARRLLDALLAMVPDDTPPSASVLVDFDLAHLEGAVQGHLALRREGSVLPAVERALLYLHELHILSLDQGLAVFRQAMTLTVPDRAHGRYYTHSDHRPLENHYDQRVVQIHVMHEYARLGQDDIEQARTFARQWFAADRQDFLQAWFDGREELLSRATSVESWRRIVESLDHPAQEAVVQADPDDNLLVLAGPGSGKTRTLLHRCAWLVRVRRVDPECVLVLCYNRATAQELRRKLVELIDHEAWGVTVLTLHGFALRLTGRSFATAAGPDDVPDFDAILGEATALLRGEVEVAGVEADEARDRLLDGIRFVLVDEYQDLDQQQYDLLSALAGRTLSDPSEKLSLLAVGDDDQNIYAWRGATVEWIRRYQRDYDAQVHHLVDNYRSTRHIIAAANRLIAPAPDRLKAEHPIRIDRTRRTDPAGGRWKALDPVSRGRVRVVAVADAGAQARFVVDAIRRLRDLDDTLEWTDVAVLARTRRELSTLRTALEHAGVPCRWPLGRDAGFALRDVRELAAFRRHLEDLGRELVTVDDLPAPSADDPWGALIAEELAAWTAELGDHAQSGEWYLDAWWARLRDARSAAWIGQGVLLSTLHGAKGLEFPHVLIAGGGFGTYGDPAGERRLLYVGMTRAEETLCLLQRDDDPHPFLDELVGPEVVRSRAPRAAAVETVSYAILGLEDLFLDWAGRRAEGHPAHQALAALRAGDPVRLQQGDVVDEAGRQVGRLSRAGRQRWADLEERCVRARVLAVVERTAEQCDEQWRERLRVVRWGVPVVEVVLR